MKIAKGIRRLPTGLQAYVQVGPKTYSQVFPLDTAITDLKDWRERKRAQVKFGIGPKEQPNETTLAYDVTTYLKLVTHMPSYTDRDYRLTQWKLKLGSKPRSQITALDIRTVLEDWRKSGHAGGGELSNASLNQRRTALMALYTTLDGKSGRNPVRDVPAYDERASGDVIRAQPLRVWYRLLVRVGRRPWKARRKQNRGKRQPPTVTRARLRVMLWTGLPHKQLENLKPEDIDWQAKRIRVSRRKKGTGTPARWIPIVPAAVIALKQFAAAKAWGKFSRSGMHSALARAVEAENEWRARYELPGLRPIRPYDARHTFATELAKVVRDPRILEAMLLSKQRRYSEGAMEDLLLHARDQFAKAVAGNAGSHRNSEGSGRTQKKAGLRLIRRKTS